MKKGILYLLMVLILTGCSQNQTNSSTMTLEVVKETEAVREEISVTSDQLDLITKEIQTQMRVFDVVAFHDPLFERITNQLDGQVTDEDLNALITPISEAFIDELLTDKIKTRLGSAYAESDLEWIYNRIDTKALLEFMIAYEREYVKHTRK